MADAYAPAILAQQVLDSDWFRLLILLGTVAFALSGVVLAYSGGYTLLGALTLAALPAAGAVSFVILSCSDNPSASCAIPPFYFRFSAPCCSGKPSSGSRP